MSSVDRQCLHIRVDWWKFAFYYCCSVRRASQVDSCSRIKFFSDVNKRNSHLSSYHLQRYIYAKNIHSVRVFLSEREHSQYWLNVWRKNTTNHWILFTSNRKKTNPTTKHANVTYPAINSCLFNFLSPLTSSCFMISTARFFGSRSPLRSDSPTRSY